MSHTPGPWSVFMGASGKAVPRQIRADGERIAICEVDADFGGGDLAEDAANAHLISAAPDLLAACEAALETFDVAPSFCKVCNRHPADGAHREGCAVPIVVAAIAKARGGA